VPFVPWDDGNGETDDPWDSLTDEEILGFSDPAEPYQEGSCPRGGLQATIGSRCKRE